MSELAFNLNGEPFEVPGAAVGWRVRKLKSKGAPEVVYGREGIPLILPIDADMDDLRREARHEGKYRVDPVDEHSRPITGCPAGYVCVHEGEPTVEPALPPKSVPVVTTVDHAMVEAMRIQAGLAQSIVDKFAMMLEASATLLRAAQNAGMPQRLPRFFLDVEGSDEQGQAGSDDQADPTPERDAVNAAPKIGFPAIIDSCVTAGTTALVNALVSGRLKIPGGLGARVDCRRAVPKDSGNGAPDTLPSGVAPAPGPRDPAPAAGAPFAPAPVSARRAEPSAVSAAPAKDPAAPVADVPAELPTIDDATMQHFRDVLGALTLHEQMHAQALAAELSPEQLRAWIHDLQSLSVDDAAAKIRGFLRAVAEVSPDPGSPGASSAPAGAGTTGASDRGGVS